MPPRKNKFIPAPSSRATRSHTAAASRDAAPSGLETQPAVSDIAGEDRGVPLNTLVESQGSVNHGGERANDDDEATARGLYNNGHRSTPGSPDYNSIHESNEAEPVSRPAPSSTRDQKSVRTVSPEPEAKVEDEDADEAYEPKAKPTPLKHKLS
ncbi:hypothetical protein FRC07_004903 [Ceratobasidium sp. 392]|nr:hypothetical protein FRC07_004903 [Ceratobasidium sp. 392]